MEGEEGAPILLENDWLWSVQPFVIWFKCLGVDLLDANQSKLSRWFHLYRLFFLLLNIAGQIACLLFVFRNAKQLSNIYISEGGFNSDVLALNTGIDFINYAIHSVGCHLILISRFRVQWKMLAKSYNRIMSFSNRNVFVAVRKASIIAILYVITVLSVCGIIVTWYRKNDEPSFEDVVFTWLCRLSLISQIYPLTSVALFVVISYVSSNAYKQIRMDVHSLKTREKDEEYFSHLKALKSFHALVCETIENVNDCFGSHSFLAADIIFFLMHIFHLSVICYAADFIRDQAGSVQRELTRMMQIQLMEPIKSLANGFVTHADLFFPQVSTIGGFPVSKRIIPQIVATTITYFLILYQFQSSEKD